MPVPCSVKRERFADWDRQWQSDIDRAHRDRAASAARYDAAAPSYGQVGASGSRKDRSQGVVSAVDSGQVSLKTAFALL